jgi:hypothetical protein
MCCGGGTRGAVGNMMSADGKPSMIPAATTGTAAVGARSMVPPKTNAVIGPTGNGRAILFGSAFGTTYGEVPGKKFGTTYGRIGWAFDVLARKTLAGTREEPDIGDDIGVAFGGIGDADSAFFIKAK